MCFSSKFYVTYRDSDRQQTMITENRVEKSRCSGDTAAKITGLELCATLEFPLALRNNDAPWFPLTGPSSARVVLHKRDTYRGFHFEAQVVREKVGFPLSVFLCFVSTGIYISLKDIIAIYIIFRMKSLE